MNCSFNIFGNIIYSLSMKLLKSIKLLFSKKNKSSKYDNNSANEKQLQLFLNRKIDWISFNEHENNEFKENNFFDFGNDFVIYFDSNSNTETDKYIRENFNLLKSKFKEKQRNFIYLPILTNKSNIDFKTIFKHYFPTMEENNVESICNEFMNETYEDITEEFLQFISYSGNIKSGCISFTDTFVVVEQKEEETFIAFIDTYFANLSKQYKPRVFYSIDMEAFEKSKQEESETIKNLKNIEKEFQKLKESGQLMVIAPKIYNLLLRYVDEVKYDSLSDIIITKDFRILFPQNNNLEIKLSHFTKSIYLLFISNPEPIDLKELAKQKNRLFYIYKQVSNQLDHDKMKQTIDELIVTENEAIYTHLSRIKKELSKHFDIFCLSEYCIDGEKGQPKKIKFDKKRIIYNCQLFQN